MLSKDQVLEAQNIWANYVVKIGQAFTDGEDYKGIAEKMIHELYSYDQGVVLFKPTRASIHPFRSKFAEALSYFVGTNGVCKEDTGFAIEPWTAVRFENHNMVLDERMALAMGEYFFTNTKGNEVKVEYSFGYCLGDNGQLKINLHHSSLPFAN